MGVVHISNLEACALTGKTTWSQCGHTTLVRHLGKRVGLVHELRELVGAEERVDHRGDRTRIDQLARGELLHIMDVHPLLDRTGHTGHTDIDLAAELLAHGPDTTIAKVIDIIDRLLSCLQIDQVLDDRDDIVAGQRRLVRRYAQAELLVDTVTTDLAEIVALRVEEELVDKGARGLEIRSLATTELAVDCLQGILLATGDILLNRLDDDRVGLRSLLGEHLDRLGAAEADTLEQRGIQSDILGRDDLAGVHVDHIARYNAIDVILVQIVERNLLGQREKLQQILVGGEAESAQQSSDRELLLAIDIGIHHVLDVGGKLHPRAAERDDTCREDPCTVGMDRIGEEHAGGAMKLRHHDAFGAVDDERATVGHRRDIPEIDLLLDRLDEIIRLPVGLRAEAQACLQRHCERQLALATLVDRILGALDPVIDKLEGEDLARVMDGKIRDKCRLKPHWLPLLTGNRLPLQKITIRRQLHIEQIRHLDNLGDGCERHTVLTVGHTVVRSVRNHCIYLQSVGKLGINSRQQMDSPQWPIGPCRESMTRLY